MKVAIVGAGVVGRATGVAMLSAGHHDVTFYDVNVEAFRELPDSFSCICTTDLRRIYRTCDVYMVCLPTPTGAKGACDISAYENFVKLLSVAMQRTYYGHKTIVQKSTCPPGTAAAMVNRILAMSICRDEFGYLVCPEFLNAGAPLAGAVAPVKTIVGYEYKRELEIAERLFNWIPRNKMFSMSYAEAEFAKYANNLFHAMLISMWNELKLIGDRFSATTGAPDIDMDQIARLTAMEPGLESIYRVFGKAWGGSCLPKDTRAFRAFAGQLGMSPRIVEALILVNEVVRSQAGTETKHWDELH